jgi:hypothetical protein
MFSRFKNTNMSPSALMTNLPPEALNDPEIAFLQNNIMMLRQQIVQIADRLTMGGAPITECDYLKTSRTQVTAAFDAAVLDRDKLIAEKMSKAGARSFAAQAGFAFPGKEQPMMHEQQVGYRQPERGFKTPNALFKEAMVSLEYQELRHALWETTERLTKLEEGLLSATSLAKTDK